MARDFGKQLVQSLVLISCCVVSLQLRAAELTPADQRLVAVAKLWRDVKWLHPALAHGDVDWDAALAGSLPQIHAARTPAELKLALAGLMAPLHDPAVRFDAEPRAGLVDFRQPAPVLEWLDGDVALLHLHDGALKRVQDDPAFTGAAGAIFARAKALVVDLRPASAPAYLPLDLNRLADGLIDKPLWLPAARVRTHSGYEPQGAQTSGRYYSAFETRDTTRLMPAKGARPMPTVFVINNMRLVPPAVLALQRAGKAFILAQGAPSPAWLVAPNNARIEGGTVVRFSTAEMIFEDGSSGFGADAIAPDGAATGADSAVTRAALALLRSGRTPGAGIAWAHPPVLAAKQVEDMYPAMAFPELAWRQLAVIKLWAVADAFFPYKQYMDAPWEAALAEFLKRMETVAGARDYALAMAAMANRLGDNHVGAWSPEIAKVLGSFVPGVRLSLIEGRIVVSSFASEELARDSGLKLGDVVISVDGEDAGQRLARLGEVTGGSREEMRQRRALTYLLAAPYKVDATLRVEDGAGRRRDVTLERKAWLAGWRARSGPVMQVLDGNVGYVDLDRLEMADFNDMVSRMRGTRALILDMRGYPHSTGMALASWLNVKGGGVGAKFVRPMLSALDFLPGQSLNSVQMIAPGPMPAYQGKVVMLIDGRAQSQSEHTALFVEAAAPVTFIGSRTSGANGDITNTVLPGNIRVSFTGQEVRHGDGRQLQRVGIEPHIAAAPTLAGLRAGRDEVLERARQFIDTGK
jgi:C-terminal processing protease CtpA/Prc